MRIIVGLLLFILVGFAAFMAYQKTAQNTPTNQPEIVSTPTPQPSTQSEIHSPDGTMNLIMQKKSLEDNSQVYSFFTQEIAKKSKLLLFTKTVNEENSMTIPYNSWSPDNKYVFIQENNASSLAFLVFTASGDNFSNGLQYLDVIPLFDNLKTAYKVSTITGWDSPTLMHVKTVTAENKKGPSYWFDVTSRVFLQLANR